MTIDTKDDDVDGASNFGYDRLWYIQLREGSKLPRFKWGGYSQDFESAEHVHDHESVVASDWDRWGIVGIQTPTHSPDLSLLVLDHDIYKSNDPESEAERVDVPANAPVVKTGSGGHHIYGAVQLPRGSAKESDFQLVHDIDWDVDIRGSLVSHHVVAPGDIPGVETEYELVNDKTIPGYLEPGDVENGFSYDGDPLVTYRGERSTPDVEYDIPEEAPEDLPLCMGRLLNERVKDDHPNQFKIHTYAGMLGYALGYDTAELLSLFVEEYPYGGGADREKTREHLERLKPKIESGELLPPAEHTLRDFKLISEDESCDCAVHGDGGHDGFQRVVLAADTLDNDRLRAFAKKRGYSWPSTREVRQQLRNVISRAMRAGQNTVIDAPTGSGKSFAVATESWRGRASTTGEAPVVHLHETTTARDEAAAMSDQAGASYRVVLGRKEACPCAAGEHDGITVNNIPASDFLDIMCDDKLVPFSRAHTLLLEWCDQDIDELPCEQEGECDAKRQYDGIPWDENGDPGVDVIHATHQFAYVPSFRLGTNVVIDEMPDFSVNMGQDRVRRAVTSYLHEIDAPVTNFESFVSLARFSPSGASDAADEREQTKRVLGDTPDADWYVTDDDANALAPALAEAIWQACESESNIVGWSEGMALAEPPRFDKEQFGDAPTSSVLRVVIDDDNTLRSIRNVPYLGAARSVIGLDAQPSSPVWRANTMDGIGVTRVLQPEQRQLWRRFERGLTTVQIGDATRPRSGSKATEWMNDKRLRAIFGEIESLGDLETAVTTLQTKDRLRELLEERGVDPELMNYGNEKSRNDFAGESVGYVYGCMDPGDDYILTILTELGLEAKPVTVDTEDGTKREKGRTFEGPDADEAADVLASVRENHVAQAAGRYARNAADADDEATVFVDTNAAPDGFIDIQVPGVEWLATETQAEIIDGLQERGASTASELAEYAGCTAENVRHLLRKLAGDGVVQRAERAGAFGADIWRDDGAGIGDVDLPKSALSKSTSRWVLAITDRLLDDAGDDAEVSPDGRSGGWPAGVETD